MNENECEHQWVVINWEFTNTIGIGVKTMEKAERMRATEVYCPNCGRKQKLK